MIFWFVPTSGDDKPCFYDVESIADGRVTLSTFNDPIKVLRNPGMAAKREIVVTVSAVLDMIECGSLSLSRISEVR
jgi:hypothetical protein